MTTLERRFGEIFIIQGRESPDMATGVDDDATPEVSDEVSSSGPSFSYTVYECPNCSTKLLGVEAESPDLSCCGRSLEPVGESGLEHPKPELKQLLAEVYDMPKMSIDICFFVFESGSASVSDVAEHFGYDRSTVSRYLGELAEAGFIDRHVLNREQGGTIHVYKSKSIDEIRRDAILALLDWAGTGALIMDEANGIKADCIESDDGTLDQVFWEVYQQERTV
jgi:predicted transcriptional regulator